MNTENAMKIEGSSGRKLLRSTAIAFVVAMVLLVTVVMPSEYGIDPTRIGRLLGLTEMGEIKEQLHDEAEADQAAASASANGSAGDDEVLSRLDAIDERLSALDRTIQRLYQLLEQAEARRATKAALDDLRKTVAARQQVAAEQAQKPKPAPQAPAWRDEATVTLAPGIGTEFKLVMKKGARAEFSWTANGSVLNYDTHGEGRGKSIMYERGRGKPGGEGELIAAFSGTHGWFWRNRTKKPVTLTIRARGDYAEFKRLK